MVLNSFGLSVGLETDLNSWDTVWETDGNATGQTASISLQHS